MPVSFGGIEARWVATLDPTLLQKSADGSKPYTIFKPKKVQKQVFAKGKPVFELVDPDGNIYVLQAHDDGPDAAYFPGAVTGMTGIATAISNSATAWILFSSW